MQQNNTLLVSRTIALNYAIAKYSKKGNNVNVLTNAYIIRCLNKAIKSANGNVAVTRIFKGVRNAYYFNN